MQLLSSVWFKLVMSLAVLTGLLYTADIKQFVFQLKSARLDYLLLAFVGYLLGQFVSACKWRLIAVPFGFPDSLKTFVSYYFAGMYLNLVGPSIIVGDVGRGYLLATGKTRLVASLQTVVIDRVVGLVMLVWVNAAGFLAFGSSVFPRVLYYWTVFGAVASCLFWWVLPCLVRNVFFPEGSLRRFTERVILLFGQNPGLLCRVCVVSVLFHMFQILLQWVVARSLGLEIPLWFLVLFIPAVQIVSMFPVSFAGLGVREAGYVVGLSLWGIGRDEAFAYGLVWSGLVIGANLLGGVAWGFLPKSGLLPANSKKRL